MFSRSDNPLVSILLPSRGRADWLSDAVDSIYSLAAVPQDIEFIFKVDSDDADSINIATKLNKLLNSQTIVSPRGKGYHELHNFINQMSLIAKGDWLFIFNDDARMKTQDWDEVLTNVNPWTIPRWEGSNDVCLLGPKVTEREISWEFPILRRKVVQILGHFSQCYSNDAYIYWVMSDISAACVLTTIEISHFVNDVNDLTKTEGKLEADKTMAKIMADKELKKLYQKDRDKLRHYMEHTK